MGHKSDLAVYGFLRSMDNGDGLGIAVMAELCLRFARHRSYEQWYYPLMRFENAGKDLNINDLNNRLQYRADTASTE